MKLLEYFAKNKKRIIIFLLIVTIISCVPILLSSEIQVGHDLPFHLSRITAVKDGLLKGNFHQYVYQNYLNGYGYGNPLFYSDFFLLLPAYLMKMGMKTVLSYKVFLFVISFFSCFTMFLAMKGITKKTNIGLISSLVYGLSSYRFTDLYTRAALGESLAFIFLPLVILGIYMILYGDEKKSYYLVIGMSGLILSHLLSSYLVVITLAAICIIHFKEFWKDKRKIKNLVIATLLTVGITSFFLFPMLEQLKTTEYYISIPTNSNIYQRSVPFLELFSENSKPTFLTSWHPNGVGYLSLIFIIIGFIYFKKMTKMERTFLIIACFSLIMASNLFPWNYLNHKIFNVFQFPWRAYLIATTFLSMSIGITLVKYMKYKKVGILMVAVCSLYSSVVAYFNYQKFTSISESSGYWIGGAEYLPAKTNYGELLEREYIVTSNKELDYVFTKNGENLYVTLNESVDDVSLEFPLLYYKGYVAELDGKTLPVQESENGYVQVNLKNVNSGKITVHYAGTKIQKYSAIVSIVTLVITVLYFSKIPKKYFKIKRSMI